MRSPRPPPALARQKLNPADQARPADGATKQASETSQANPTGPASQPSSQAHLTKIGPTPIILAAGRVDKNTQGVAGHVDKNCLGLARHRGLVQVWSSPTILGLAKHFSRGHLFGRGFVTLNFCPAGPSSGQGAPVRPGIYPHLLSGQAFVRGRGPAGQFSHSTFVWLWDAKPFRKRP